ncbi:MAG: pyruvate dehydrogenase (acetyl-transferring) E1 component subunit alpha, partial [Alphaproteobacteria bacterium]
MAKADATARSSAAAKPRLDKDALLHFYREMLLFRRFEERAGQLYGRVLMGGFCPRYVGQEAGG